MPSWLYVLAAALVGLGGCAGTVTKRVGVDAGAKSDEERIQQKLAIQSTAQMEQRLRNVGYGVLKGAADQCGAITRPLLGFFIASKDRVPAGPNRDLIIEALAVDDVWRVSQVYKGSAAEVAGLQRGDVLPQDLNPAFKPLATPETREAARARLANPMTVVVLRGTERVNLTIAADTVCDYALRMTPGNEVNAYADGKQIVVTRGMLRFAAEDRELALVIGHELGHNTMGHLDKKMQNAGMGAALDILTAVATRGAVNTQGAFANAAAQVYSQDFESEADYVGLYYLARAGYETTGAADFWRRMAAEYPGSIKSSHTASHPATAERFLALEKVSTEVDGKKANGASLVPERVK